MKYFKDPEATLDYIFDWSDWLQDGETISTFLATVPAGLTVGTGEKATSQINGMVKIWLSSGTVGTTYKIECKITTNSGRVDERELFITVKER